MVYTVGKCFKKPQGFFDLSTDLGEKEAEIFKLQVGRTGAGYEDAALWECPE